MIAKDVKRYCSFFAVFVMKIAMVWNDVFE
jgi:hypothetical protein